MRRFLSRLVSGFRTTNTARPARRAARQTRQQRLARLGVEALERRDLMSASQPVALLGNWNYVGGPVQAVSTVLDANNNLDVFGIGTDHAVSYSSRPPTSPYFSGWTSLGGAMKSISAIKDGRGILDVFAVGTNNAVWYGSLSPTGAFSGWTSLGGAVTSITTTLDAHNNLDVFAIGCNNAVWYNSQYYSSFSWSGWMSLGGAFKSSSASLNAHGNLSTSLDAQGNLDVFGIGTDSAVYVNSQSSTSGSWSGWKNLGGAVLAISTSLDGQGNLDVFGIGTDLAVWYRSQSPNGGSFSGWTSLGLGTNQQEWLSVNAGLDGRGNLYVFTLGTDGSVNYQEMQPYNGTWSGWMSLGGTMKSLSVLPGNNPGNLNVFAIGIDNAVRYQQSATYSYASGTLFGPNGPSYLDVEQGVLPDCWLLASLAEVAARAPSIIKSMFTYEYITQPNGTIIGEYKVRFYNQSGQPQYVLVDTELPDGGTRYDRPVNGVLWVALAEKAYVEANAAGIVTSYHVGIDDYDALNIGKSVWALQAITGLPASNYSINPSDIAAAWNQGKFIVLDTTTPASSYIVKNHVYALVNYSAYAAYPFEVFNPWGTDANGWAPGNLYTKYGLVWLSKDTLSQNFNDVAQTGAAAGMPALPGADAAAQLSADEAAAFLARHKRTSASDALFADPNSF
jgi:hypothetical protein